MKVGIGKGLQRSDGRSRRRLVVHAIAAAAVTVVLLVPAGAAMAKTKPKPTTNPTPALRQCTPITGPQWTWPADTYQGSDLYNAQISSTLYEAFAINISCAQATTYIKQLITQTLPVTTPGAVSQLSAGGGIPCFAYPDKEGKAYAGECVSGSLKFDWNYNVQWHGVPDSTTGEGGIGVEPMGTIEYTTILRPLGGTSYELVVQNSSAIGAINTFNWAAPPGLTITAVTQSKGATCSLAQDGSIGCNGNLLPPTCLCTGSGGEATVWFTATGDQPTILNGHPVIHGLSWSYLHITVMTPVPYLVPDTPQKVNKNV
jgi:hypothetical protein